MSLRKISSEVGELINVQEAFRQMYILSGSETAEDSAMANHLIKSVRLTCENYTWRQLVETQYELRLDSFPDEIILPKPPCISVDSVKYVNGSGTLTTLATSEYQVDLYSEPARIRPVTTFPTPKEQYDSVIITFTCGYNGVETESLPDDLKTSMLMLIKYLFDNRDAVAVSEGRSIDVKELPFSVTHIWGAYSVRTFA